MRRTAELNTEAHSDVYQMFQISTSTIYWATRALKLIMIPTGLGHSPEAIPAGVGHGHLKRLHLCFLSHQHKYYMESVGKWLWDKPLQKIMKMLFKEQPSVFILTDLSGFKVLAKWEVVVKNDLLVKDYMGIYVIIKNGWLLVFQDLGWKLIFFFYLGW